MFQGDYLDHSSASALAEDLHSVPFLSAGSDVQTLENAIGFGSWTLLILASIGVRNYTIDNLA